METQFLKVKITNQGGPMLSDDKALIERQGKDVIAASIDMRSKRAVLYGNGLNDYPIILIGADEDTLNLKKGKEKELTEIAFPELRGWRIWTANISRYTLFICFTRKPVPY